MDGWMNEWMDYLFETNITLLSAVAGQMDSWYSFY